MFLAFIVYLFFTLTSLATFFGLTGTISVVVGAGCWWAICASAENDGVSVDEYLQNRIPKMWAKVCKWSIIYGFFGWFMATIIPTEEQLKYIGGAYVVAEGYEALKEAETIKRLSPKAGKIVELYADKLIAELEQSISEVGKDKPKEVKNE